MNTEIQQLIDGVPSDQYTLVGKLHQLKYTLGWLTTHGMQAVDLFSGYHAADNVTFYRAVDDSLDVIATMEQALNDAKTILMWMRARRKEILNISKYE